MRAITPRANDFMNGAMNVVEHSETHDRIGISLVDERCELSTCKGDVLFVSEVLLKFAVGTGDDVVRRRGHRLYLFGVAVFFSRLN